MAIVWDDKEFKLGNDSMDHIHREFVDIYNDAQKNSTEISIALTKLIEHSISHFEYEEAIMETFDYSNKNEHKQEHQKALAEMKMFLAKSSSPFGKKLAISYFNERLPDWFRVHLRNMDSDFNMQINQKLGNN